MTIWIYFVFLNATYQNVIFVWKLSHPLPTTTVSSNNITKYLQLVFCLNLGTREHEKTSCQKYLLRSMFSSYFKILTILHNYHILFEAAVWVFSIALCWESWNGWFWRKKWIVINCLYFCLIWKIIDSYENSNLWENAQVSTDNVQLF